jgi:predicted nuclease of predicted toxin-antitoxin system
LSKPPSFLADLNISPLSVTRLRQAGWDIVRSSDRLPANATDEEILALARQESKVILTQDLDFSALLAVRGLDRPSLVTLRLASSDPQEVERKLLETRDLLVRVLGSPCAVTIDDRGARVRKLPIE